MSRAGRGEAYDFSQFGTIVDVGGGHGHLLDHDPEGEPEVEGHRVRRPARGGRGSETPIRAAGLADRCRAEGGDFFKAVPAGGDAYMMKHIIHDWPDDKAATILKNCRKGVEPGRQVLLVELVVPPGNVPDLAKMLDLEMMVICRAARSGRKPEYRDARRPVPAGGSRGSCRRSRRSA